MLTSPCLSAQLTNFENELMTCSPLVCAIYNQGFSVRVFSIPEG